MNHQRLYEYRFRGIDQDVRAGVWQEIAPFIHREVMGSPHAVLDPAAVVTPLELEFSCQEPGTAAPLIAAGPQDLATRAYYSPGATVRSVNGRFEKIGYHVRPTVGAA